MAEVEWRIKRRYATFEKGVTVVVMPCCGFSFAAAHTDTPDSDYYTCPLCEPIKEKCEMNTRSDEHG